MDADFAGGWSQEVGEEVGNVMYRTRMVIIYANCPIYWLISTQTKIAPSTAESQYIALSSALREVLKLMKMMEEINEVLLLKITKPIFV